MGNLLYDHTRLLRWTMDSKMDDVGQRKELDRKPDVVVAFLKFWYNAHVNVEDDAGLCTEK